MSQRDPQKILDIFDGLDLDNPEQRRIGLYTINDYFGAVLAEVGEQLDFRTSDFDAPIGYQWEKASSRLEKIDSVEVPEEYYTALKKIDELRGAYAHDFRDYPSPEHIESARQIAPEWAEWLREEADEYEIYQESLTATEALVQVGERALENTLGDSRKYHPYFHDRVRDLNEQASELKDALESFREEDEVTRELVDVISEIFEWERERDRVKANIEDWKDEEAKRREQLDRAENTYNFVVVDEAGEFDSLGVVKHQMGEPDHGYAFTISNCPISDEEMDYLRDLEEDDEVRLWVGSEMHMDSSGKIHHEDIIKEVVNIPDNKVNVRQISDW